VGHCFHTCIIFLTPQKPAKCLTICCLPLVTLGCFICSKNIGHVHTCDWVLVMVIILYVVADTFDTYSCTCDRENRCTWQPAFFRVAMCNLLHIRTHKHNCTRLRQKKFQSSWHHASRRTIRRCYNDGSNDNKDGNYNNKTSSYSDNATTQKAAGTATSNGYKRRGR